jgi:tetratricopeptide (TPR) repeat protein
VAVYEVPLNQEAISAVVGTPGGGLQSMVEAWTSLGLVSPLNSGLLVIDSHLRRWLLDRQGKDQIAMIHRDAGDFLRALAEQRRSGDLGISRLDCMLEARGHYLASGDVERARDATNRVSGFLMGRGMYYDVRNLNESLLSREKSPSTMSWIAQACAEQGDYNAAQDWHQKCLDASLDDSNAANSWHGLASIDLHFGRYDLARSNFQKALEIYRRLGDRAGEAVSLHGIASIETALGENDPARADLEKVLELQETLGDISGQASTLHDLIVLDLRVPNYKAARAKLESSVQILRQIGDSSGEASAMQNMASIDMEIGELDLAREEFQRALQIRQLLGDKAGEASVMQGLASAEVQRGNDNAAFEAFRKALEIFQEVGDKSGEASSLFQLGVMASLQGKTKEGLGLIALSGIILRNAGSPDFEQVEPVVERLASQLNYSQDQFMQMIRQVTGAYRRDKGKNLLESAFGKGS